MHRIYFLREGKLVDSDNETEDYSKKDLEEIRDSYSPKIFKAPIVIGHSDDIKALYENDKAPSFGWIEKLGLDNKGLYADVKLAKEFENLLDKEVPPYKYISAAIYDRNNPFNPTKGEKKYIRHIAFLGGQPPAIKGLPDIVKLYSEKLPDSELLNTKTLFNNNQILKINSNNTNNMTVKKYMVDDLDVNQEVVKLPNPETATAEEINSFLDSNSFDFLSFILTDGEYGYPGEITRFENEPSAENNYLFDSESNTFSGIFYDDNSSEIDGYEFEIKKTGDGWTSSYIPVNQNEESDTEDNFSEGEETLEDLEVEEVELVSTEDENSLASGIIPEETPEPETEVDDDNDEDDIKSELELMKSEATNLRNEVLKLKNELNELKMNEYRAYSEKFTPIIEGTNISTNELASLLYEVELATNKRRLTKNYSEVVKEKPVQLLKKVLEETLEKVKNQKVISYGEFKPEGEETPEELVKSETPNPVGAVYSDEGMELHKEVISYCNKKGLDPKDPTQYLEALKAVSK